MSYNQDKDTSPFPLASQASAGPSVTQNFTNPSPIFEYEEVEGVESFTEIEPSDCKGDVYVKKKMCHKEGTDTILTGSNGLCGDGVEEWILDPNAPGYHPEVGNGTCVSEFRPCNVPCDSPCEGNTWIDGVCKRNGVVLDGSSDETCGQGMMTKTLDETASDYKAAVGNGSCTKTYDSACFVECPVNVVPPKVCTYQTTRQKSANGCVKSKDSGADPVGYDESGWQEYFRVALEGENCEGEQRLVEWETCSGPPAPVDCVGNWVVSEDTDADGWGSCQGSCGTQPTQSRTYKITTEAANGGKTNTCLHPDNHKETKNCGNIQPCCEPQPWEEGTCGDNGLNVWTRTLLENSPGACANESSEDPKPCCYQGGDWVVDGACGDHQANKQRYKQTTVGSCTSGTEYKYEDCQNCEGYHENPSCPTQCGKGASTLTKKWVTTKAPTGTGKACPANSSKSCPATSACPVDCTGYWSEGSVTRWQGPTRCDATRYKYRTDTYIVTRNKVGTGRSCPHGNNETRTLTVDEEDVDCY